MSNILAVLFYNLDLRIMNKLFSIIFFIAFCVNVGQTQTVKQFKKKAQQAFDNQNYYAALAHYSTIVDADSSSMDIMYNYAEAARNYNAYTMAENSYQQVANSEESAEFPLTNYWLAGVKKNLGKYSEAKELYTKYLSNNQEQSSDFAKKAQQEIEYLSWAETIASQPIEGVEIEHLGSEVNSPYSEMSPINKDGELFYSSFKFENEEDEAYPFRPISKVLSAKENQSGMEVEGDINSQTRHSAHMTFNTTGDRMYFTICDYINKESTEIYCEIYYKEVNADGSWSNTLKLSENINAVGYTSTQPNIGLDENGNEVLYFVSNRLGGKGGSDIWYAKVGEDGSLGTAQALADINTPGEDISPFYHNDTRTLYFSSDGRKGLGGLDIYKTEKSNNSWTEVEHIGVPINSSFNDLDYSLNADETEAFFASNRIGSMYLEESKEACCNDIYKVTMVEQLFDMKALTFNKNTDEPLNGVKVELLLVKEVVTEDSNAEGNEYDFKVKRKKQYLIKASKPGFESDEILVSTDNIETEDVIGKLYLEPYTMSLLAKTFDSETKSALTGVTMKLVECNSLDGETKVNNDANDFNYPVSPEKCYKLLVSKPGYVPKTVEIKTDPLTGNIIMEEDIYLDKVPPVTRLTLEGYLPMPLYFDNDEPDKRSTKRMTSKTYPETHSAYMARKQIFKDKFSAGLTTELKSQAEFEIEQFFTNDVAPAETGLKSFTDHLLRYLEQGNIAEIIIKGYTSPRAKTEYNAILAQRRISSIRNHFASYQGGIFQTYIAKGFLKVSEAPLGETAARQGVSDDIFDERNSIYSVPASLERRVEIIELK